MLVRECRCKYFQNHQFLDWSYSLLGYIGLEFVELQYLAEPVFVMAGIQQQLIEQLR